jgi:hypothetical protein
VADEDIDALRGLCEASQLTLTGAIEIRACQKIFRRVAAQGQFGCEEDVCTGIARSDGSLAQPACVAGDIAHYAVDLRDGDLQGVRVGPGK